jgi:hypothetical protein
MSTRTSRIAAVLTVAVVLAACGSKTQSQAAAVATTVATAGASTTGSTVAGATTTTVTGGDAQGGQRRQQLQAWRDCLSQHGVTLPSLAPRQNGQGQNGQGQTDPNGSTPPAAGQLPAGADPGGGRGGPGGGAFTSILADPANKAAVDACASLQPQGGPGNGGNGGNGARGQAFQAYLSCLKDNGVDVPTTVAGGPPASIDRATPAYAAANEKCQVLLPQRQGDGSTTTTAAG